MDKEKEDDMAVDEEKEASKLCAYKLLKTLGESSEGSVIHVPDAVGRALCEAGVAELATEDDMAPKEDELPEETPMVANAVERLGVKVEKVLKDSVAKAMQTKATQTPLTVPAEVKKGSPYRSPGAYIAGIMKAVAFGDKTEGNKVMAYQEEAAEVYKGMGFSGDNIKVKSILGINETTNSQGGYLVNPQFSKDVYVIPHGQLDLLAQCGETVNAESNVYNQRTVNESSLANGSIFGGLNMVATAEGASFTSSLPAWSNTVFTLQKLAIFNYYTSEILQDASYPIESELNEYVNKAFVYGLNTQLIQGSTLEGALNAPSLVTVTHSSNDTAWSSNASTSLTYADLANIWASVYPDCQESPKGMWLMHPSLIASLVQMTYTFSGSAPAWGITYDAREGLRPGSDGPTSPYRIFGKPAYASWACSAPGVAGDVLYIDFGTFLHYKKPFRVEVSSDFQFGTDQIAVRFVARLDAKTKFRQKVTGVNGTQQFGPIVTRSSSGS